jgi:hypothetical protein
VVAHRQGEGAEGLEAVPRIVAGRRGDAAIAARTVARLRRGAAAQALGRGYRLAQCDLPVETLDLLGVLLDSGGVLFGELATLRLVGLGDERLRGVEQCGAPLLERGKRVHDDRPQEGALEGLAAGQ